MQKITYVDFEVKILVELSVLSVAFAFLGSRDFLTFKHALILHNLWLSFGVIKLRLACLSTRLVRHGLAAMVVAISTLSQRIHAAALVVNVHVFDGAAI